MQTRKCHCLALSTSICLFITTNALDCWVLWLNDEDISPNDSSHNSSSMSWQPLRSNSYSFLQRFEICHARFSFLIFDWVLDLVVWIENVPILVLKYEKLFRLIQGECDVTRYRSKSNFILWVVIYLLFVFVCLFLGVCVF